MGEMWEKLAKTWPARAAQGLWEGLTLPGDVYQGNVSMYGDDGRTNPQVIDRAANLAGTMASGSLGAIPENSLGSGAARMRMIEQADLYKELANQRRAQGLSVGKAAPGHEFKRPDAAKGSWADLVARTKAKWEGDKALAINDFEKVAPGAVPGSKYMTADDWAFIAKNGGLAVPLTVGLGLAASRDDQ